MFFEKVIIHHYSVIQLLLHHWFSPHKGVAHIVELLRFEGISEESKKANQRLGRDKE
jgi:hypothetical protein